MSSGKVCCVRQIQLLFYIWTCKTKQLKGKYLKSRPTQQSSQSVHGPHLGKAWQETLELSTRVSKWLEISGACSMGKNPTRSPKEKDELKQLHAEKEEKKKKEKDWDSGIWPSVSKMAEGYPGVLPGIQLLFENNTCIPWIWAVLCLRYHRTPKMGQATCSGIWMGPKLPATCVRA